VSESRQPPSQAAVGVSRRVRALAEPPRAVGAPPPPLPPQWTISESDFDSSPNWWADHGRLESLAWLVSLVVHAVVLFALGLITFDVRAGGPAVRLLASLGTADAPAPARFDRQPPLVLAPSVERGTSPADALLDAASVGKPLEKPSVALTAPRPGKLSDRRPVNAGTETPTAPTATSAAESPTGGGFEGRDPARRAALAGRRGGPRQSEYAVDRGLTWLVAHQAAGGGWRFDLKKPPCNGLCRNSGDEPSTTAATGLALLPFLGAGYTHAQGEHQDAVKRGLYYLSTRAKVTPHGVDLREGGSMYAQGIAAVALCEAYAMTGDESLREIAQGAIRFIVYAQDLRGGGWRYSPGEPGDTTVTAWQLIALKSAQLARLDEPSPTLGLVVKFLDGVQFEGGARYGYQSPLPREDKQEATTAVGLLCRMYTGWRRDNPAVDLGVALLHKGGPSETNMYYDYYAAQVLHHWEGQEGQTWNARLRDYLVARQSQNSHEAGSWHFPDPYGDKGGRLYNTAMALMILEVYYRHMPLYGQEAVNKGI